MSIEPTPPATDSDRNPRETNRGSRHWLPLGVVAIGLLAALLVTAAYDNDGEALLSPWRDIVDSEAGATTVVLPAGVGTTITFPVEVAIDNLDAGRSVRATLATDEGRLLLRHSAPVDVRVTRVELEDDGSARVVLTLAALYHGNQPVPIESTSVELEAKPADEHGAAGAIRHQDGSLVLPAGLAIEFTVAEPASFQMENA